MDRCPGRIAGSHGRSMSTFSRASHTAVRTGCSCTPPPRLRPPASSQPGRRAASSLPGRGSRRSALEAGPFRACASQALPFVRTVCVCATRPPRGRTGCVQCPRASLSRPRPASGQSACEAPGGLRRRRVCVFACLRVDVPLPVLPLWGCAWSPGLRSPGALAVLCGAPRRSSGPACGLCGQPRTTGACDGAGPAGRVPGRLACWRVRAAR